MGTAIIKTLLAKGYSVSVYNRTRSKAEGLLSLGCQWCETPAQLSEQCETVFLCISGTEAAKAVLWDRDSGLCSAENKASTVIDLSTLAPSVAESFEQTLASEGVTYVSCPVSGGAEGAEAGTLAAIVSGPARRVADLTELLSSFTGKITVVESAARAQTLKVLNNLAESINLLGALEVLSAGKRLGCSLEEMEQAFMSCRGRSAYMQVALDYLKSGLITSNVGLDVRCKDIGLADDLVRQWEELTVSDTVIKQYQSLWKTTGAEGDQCDYYRAINKSELALEKKQS